VNLCRKVVEVIFSCGFASPRNVVDKNIGCGKLARRQWNNIGCGKLARRQ
jgi:hypothetical protein